MPAYQILSGNYETGTAEQQAGYQGLFGDNTQAKFDLYFHWFNLAHELGHCLVNTYGHEMDRVEEEIYVNCFAVQLWQLADPTDRLAQLRTLIGNILSGLPVLLPPDADFHDYFLSIWGSDQMNTVAMYGYFQMCCVAQALADATPLPTLLAALGIGMPADYTPILLPAQPVSAREALDCALANLEKMGCTLTVDLLPQDNPEIQCCRIV